MKRSSPPSVPNVNPSGQYGGYSSAMEPGICPPDKKETRNPLVDLPIPSRGNGGANGGYRQPFDLRHRSVV